MTLSAKRSQKEKLTKIIVGELRSRGIALPTEDIDKLISHFWFSGRAGQGLRLTEKGMEAFAKADIAHYDYPIGIKNVYPVNKLTVDLSRKIKCPYYLWLKQGDKGAAAYIRIYDHKTAMLISIYGTLLDYIESVGDRT